MTFQYKRFESSFGFVLVREDLVEAAKMALAECSKSSGPAVAAVRLLQSCFDMTLTQAHAAVMIAKQEGAQ